MSGIRTVGAVAATAIALAAGLAGCSGTSSATPAGENLCSLDGLMELIPALKNSDGKFEIPDPNSDLDGFLAVQRGLAATIEVELTKAAVQVTAQEAATEATNPLTFPSQWRSAEIGVSTDGKTVQFPDSGKLGSYGGPSFLAGIQPVAGTSGAFYQVTKPDGTTPALVSATPTALPCVNRLTLAAANTAGTWLPPTYALGTTDGQAYLIIDSCVDLAKTGSVNDKPVLEPTAELFTAIQWAESPDTEHMNTDAPARQHGA